MGLGDWMIKKTAKSTADSISRYVNSGQFGSPDSALQAWAMTRRDGGSLVALIQIFTEQGVPTYLIAHSLFNREMGIDDTKLKPKVSKEISEIFRQYLLNSTNNCNTRP